MARADGNRQRVDTSLGDKFLCLGGVCQELIHAQLSFRTVTVFLVTFAGLQ